VLWPALDHASLFTVTVTVTVKFVTVKLVTVTLVTVTVNLFKLPKNKRPHGLPLDIRLSRLHLELPRQIDLGWFGLLKIN
jgi:hypothetical protein